MCRESQYLWTYSAPPALIKSKIVPNKNNPLGLGIESYGFRLDNGLIAGCIVDDGVENDEDKDDAILENGHLDGDAISWFAFVVVDEVDEDEQVEVDDIETDDWMQ